MCVREGGREEGGGQGEYKVLHVKDFPLTEIHLLSSGTFSHLSYRLSLSPSYCRGRC